ncbi:ribonuclease Y [Candidatus Gottesmanbacteria bacterium RIFCSPLOWO2_01_FULL_43_11b]|uniref:Ribonuclease Y n=1 Tax=Candidatus Gottesmanbacteria bacterium RIFCSPLOWO2_01_FULL_43_11b TaxID=1798392 RepID=A0A1F6AIX4_9BACT|nr:MAG: ribonuclease Y [Candidatus Gottesmanbacteria bacterium RIFCSPLOWO2_01_FULL_43_11b]
MASVDVSAQIRLAEAQAREILLEAKDEARNKLIAIERREGAVEEREKRANEFEERVKKTLAEMEKLKADELAKLQKIASLTRSEAKDIILASLKDELKVEMAKLIKEEEAGAHEEAEKKAKEILVDAMRHGATDYVPEFTVSVVKVTDEEMKGRIIGKEGRNIRAFEMATGVDVDLDEEGVIRLSSFDPVRREIARISLERLLRDGRVQPTRIEELVDIVKKETERIMFDEGQKLCHSVGVYNLPAPLVAMLGRFKYRFSYGQNMIAHTLEETKIGIALGQEVGADVNVVRLGCLLHDIGKIVTDEEGSHVELGVSLLKKYGLPQKVIDCVAQHHEDTPFSSIESMIVYISDAISGSRPGARYEDIEGYIKRLNDLETIAKSHKGVKEAFAFQAGRELRIIVDPGSVDDAASSVMAHEVKEEVEKKMTYPGQIKISVIRELRATEIAK